jgi:SAM-dependent methyltransferase
MAETAQKQQDLPAYYHQTRPELVRMLEAKGKRILEVGCAAGAMGSALLAAGAREVVGIDVHEPALEMARGRLSAAHRIDLNALTPLPYPPGHFDIITFADVLEHLVEPVAVLRHLDAWLADDGVILISIPNVRHESVCLPLLVEGRWDYADWGILDRTHLRFFTRPGVARLLEDSGYVQLGPMAASTTPAPPWLARAAELVTALGGDAARFLDEACVVQFIFRARKSGSRAPEARPAAPGISGQWKGSRKVRLLFAPDTAREASWAADLAELASQIDGNAEVTLAVALPPPLLEAPPEEVRRIAESHRLDLLLTEAPAGEPGWQRLISGASLFLTRYPDDGLGLLARRLGVEVGALPAAPPAPAPGISSEKP